MNVRTLPYGYSYENGKVVIQSAESAIVKDLFQAYLACESLLSISKRLNVKQVEYREGVVGWNKSRISRLLQDKRYIGMKGFPVLIERESFEKVQTLINAKNNQKEVNRRSGVFLLDVPVLCPSCRNEMRRRSENQYIHKERWTCTNKNCKRMIVKTDSELMRELTDLMNHIIETSDQIKVPQETMIEYEESAEARRLDNEIKIMFDSVEINKEELARKLAQYYSLTYQELPSVESTTCRLKDIFVREKPTTEFPLRLFSQTVNFIIMDAKPNGIGVVLTNGQEIRRRY